MACGERSKYRESESCSRPENHKGKHSWDRRGKTVGDDKKAMIAKGHEWVALYGEPPKKLEWKVKHGGWPSASTITTMFGSWSEYLRTAGLTVTCKNPYCDMPRLRENDECHRCREFRHLYGKPWTPEGLRRAQRNTEKHERVIAAIQAYVAEHVEPPAGWEWEKASPEHPTTANIRRLFGSWNLAIKAAGFTPRPTGIRRGVTRRK